MIRIGTYAHQQLTLAHALNSQRQMLDLQIQVSSGKISRDYAGIASDAQRLVSLETAHLRAGQYVENNSLVARRLETMETSISQVYDTASRFRTLLVNALNTDNAVDLSIANEAGNFKKEVANLLNVEVEGRYLFAGSRTDVKPVDLNGWTPPAMPLTPPLTPYASEYYQGDAVILAAEADTALSVDYGMTASENAFEYVLRAMHYVELTGSAPDRATLETALALLNTALGTESPNAALGADPIARDLADLRTAIGTSRRSLDSATQRLGEFILYTEQNIGDIENVDVAEAITQLTAQQTQLEAAFMTISRLSQLSLLQFLR